MKKSKKELWEECRKVAETLLEHDEETDLVILNLITGLIAHGFKVRWWCGGHTQKGGSPGPIVEIGNIPPETLQKKSEKYMQKHTYAETMSRFLELRKLEKENITKISSLILILNNFYRARKTTSENQLIVESAGLYGETVLHNHGYIIQGILSKSERERRLRLFRDEAKAFGVYLKQAFMESQHK